MRRLVPCWLALAATVALGGVARAASSAPTGWDGTNPFRCTLQQAGFGAVVPEPGADPYCVEFDKRRQNLTQLGIADFLLREPARVAAAGGKCFYFQSDHWRAAVVQDDATTKLYEWDGHYFFDKARGDGGVWVTNFNVNGRTGDPSAIPGLPPEFARHFGPGTGGVITHDDVPADPGCAERARRDPAAIYAPPASLAAGPPGCPDVAGPVTRRSIGPVALGDTEARIRGRLGSPGRVHRGFLRYCVAAGGGELLVGQRADRSGEFGAGADAPAVVVLTTSPQHRLHRVGPEASTRAVRRAFPRARSRLTLGRTRVLETSRGSGVLVAVRSGRVRYLAVYDRRVVRTTPALRSLLRRAR